MGLFEGRKPQRSAAKLKLSWQLGTYIQLLMTCDDLETPDFVCHDDHDGHYSGYIICFAHRNNASWNLVKIYNDRFDVDLEVFKANMPFSF